MTFIVHFEKNAVPAMTFDRVLWKDQNPDTEYAWDKKKKKPKP
jgi:hypothetical protein